MENTRKEEGFLGAYLDAYFELAKGLMESSSICFNEQIAAKQLDFIPGKRYVISDDIWTLDQEKNQAFLLGLLALVQRFVVEYSTDIEKIRGMFIEKPLTAKDFIQQVLQNKQQAISNFAKKEGFSMDFLTFYAIFAAFPYRESIAGFVSARTALKGHVSGFCPVCGHWPGISYIVEKEGKKLMACICCGSVWAFTRLKCSYCLSTDQESLGFLSIEEDDEVSAYTCEKCKRYLKTARIETADVPISPRKIFLDYMGSGHIDLAAIQNNYLQEWMLGTRFQGPFDPALATYISNY